MSGFYVRNLRTKKVHWVEPLPDVPVLVLERACNAVELLKPEPGTQGGRFLSYRQPYVKCGAPAVSEFCINCRTRLAQGWTPGAAS